jgi:hypothetical protein
MMGRPISRVKGGLSVFLAVKGDTIQGIVQHNGRFLIPNQLPIRRHLF